MIVNRPPAPLIVLSLLAIASLSFAQQDRVTIAYSEESADSSDFSLKEKYRYWTRATVEKKSMFKIGISNLGLGGSVGPLLGYRFAYERKVGLPFSVMAQYRHFMNGWINNTLGIDVAVRYYYALPRRIERGKSANNLSANYFSLQSDNSWSGSRTSLRPGAPGVYPDIGVSYRHSFSLLYGLQRRLGKYGYVDANIGYTYDRSRRDIPHLSPLYFGGNFSIGVAF